MGFQAISECPVVDVLIPDVVNMSREPMQLVVQLVQQVFKSGPELLFHGDLLCFAWVILMALIHCCPLQVSNLTLCYI